MKLSQLMEAEGRTKAEAQKIAKGVKSRAFTNRSPMKDGGDYNSGYATIKDHGSYIEVVAEVLDNVGKPEITSYLKKNGVPRQAIKQAASEKRRGNTLTIKIRYSK